MLHGIRSSLMQSPPVTSPSKRSKRSETIDGNLMALLDNITSGNAVDLTSYRRAEAFLSRDRPSTFLAQCIRMTFIGINNIHWNQQARNHPRKFQHDQWYQPTRNHPGKHQPSSCHTQIQSPCTLRVYIGLISTTVSLSCAMSNTSIKCGLSSFVLAGKTPEPRSQVTTA